MLLSWRMSSRLSSKKLQLATLAQKGMYGALLLANCIIRVSEYLAPTTVYHFKCIKGTDASDHPYVRMTSTANWALLHILMKMNMAGGAGVGQLSHGLN